MVKYQIREVSGEKRPLDLAERKNTVIGRGVYLGVADKRVSRNHGTLKPAGGGIELESIHTNPCFYTRKSEPGTWHKLDKNEMTLLAPGDTFSLLPKQYIYEVIISVEDTLCTTVQVSREAALDAGSSLEGVHEQKTMAGRTASGGATSNTRSEGKQHESVAPTNSDTLEAKSSRKTEKKQIPTEALSAEEKPEGNNQLKKEFLRKNNRSASNKPEGVGEKIPATIARIQSSGSTFTDEDGKEVALPSERKRKLPSWMVGDKKADAPDKREEKRKPKTAKTPQNKPSTARRKPQSSVAKRKVPSEILFESDSEELELYAAQPADAKKQPRKSDENIVTQSSEEHGDGAQSNVAQTAIIAGTDDDKNVVQPVVSDDEGVEVEMVDKSVSAHSSRVEKEDVNPLGVRNDKSEEGEEGNILNVSHPTSDVTSQGGSQDALAGPVPSTSAPARSTCAYGASCYRKNPAHFQEFSHPGDNDYIAPADDDRNRPECPYGTSCYRKNPLHKKQYKHTQRVAPKRAAKIRAARKRDNESSEDDYDYDDSFLNDNSDDDIDAGASEDEDSDWNPSQGSQQTSGATTAASSRGRKRKATNYKESGSDATTDDDVDELVSDAKKFSKNRKMWKK